MRVGFGDIAREWMVNSSSAGGIGVSEMEEEFWHDFAIG